jgi:hypothetical protein
MNGPRLRAPACAGRSRDPEGIDRGGEGDAPVPRPLLALVDAWSRSAEGEGPKSIFVGVVARSPDLGGLVRAYPEVRSLRSDTSRPFDRPSRGRIAVKVINHLGDVVMKVFRV